MNDKTITLQKLFEATDVPNDALISAYGNKELVFFIGAGVSRLMGIPGWDDFSTELIGGAYGNHKDRKIILDSIKSSKEKITVAYRKYCNDGREKDFFKKMGVVLRPKKLKKKENIYKVLAQFHAVFLTTNYDNLFEKELGSPLCHEELDLGVINNFNFKETKHLFYLHGKYTRSLRKNRNLVFTASSYVKKYNSNQTSDFLHGLFSKGNYVVVFIGYGLNEFELIDYIMTKSGHANDAKGKVFTLEGFFSNQEEVFQARKEYFADLNIELLPYCLDTNFYDELIRVLKNWLFVFESRTKLPALINEDIDNFIKIFSDSNVTQILNILNLDSTSATERKIINETLNSRYKKEWMQVFYDNNYLSWDYLYDSIQKKKFENPFLDLLINAMNCDVPQSQGWATHLLDNVRAETLMEPQYLYVVSKLVEIILLLDDSHIKQSYIIFIGEMIKKHGYRVFNAYNNIELPKFNSWGEENIKLFLTLLSLHKENIGNTEDLNFHYYSKLLYTINNKIEMKSWKLVIDWLIQFFMDIIAVEPYCLLVQVANIDNIEKTFYPYWRLLIDEYILAFEKLLREEQTYVINQLFNAELEAINKLAVFSCRKFNLDPNIFIKGLCKVVSNSSCLCELYIYLKNSSKLFSEINSITLSKAIINSKFGWDDSCVSVSTRQYIEEQQLTLLKFLFNNEAQKRSEELSYKGIKAIDPILIADQTDYVRSSILSVDDYIDKAILKGEDFISAIKSNFSEGNRIWHGEIIKKAIDEILLRKDIVDFKTSLHQLYSENEEFVYLFVSYFYIDREKLNDEQKNAVYDFCLGILENQELCETPLNDNCFKYLSSMDIDKDNIARRVFKCLKKWCYLHIEIDFLDEKDCYGKFINSFPYSIFRLLMIYWIYQREKEKTLLDKTEFQFFSHLLQENCASKYYFSYNFPTLCYVFGNQMEELLSNLIYTNGQFDVHSFLFCILAGETIYSNVIEYIVAHRIIEENLKLIQTCKDQRMLNRFYSYFTAAYFFKKIDKKIIELFYNDDKFIERYFYTCTQFVDKNSFLFDEYVCDFYFEIRSHIKEDKKSDVCDKMMNFMRYIENPTMKCLDTYVQVVKDIHDNTYFMSEVDKLLMFFDIDFAKALLLIDMVVEKTQYISTNDFQKLLEKVHEIKRDQEGIVLLNKYFKRFSISLEEYTRLAQILES